MDLDDESSNYGVLMFAREIRIEGEGGLPPSKGSLAVYVRDHSRLVLRVVAEGSPSDLRGRGSATGPPCEMFQRAFDASEAARSLRGAEVSDDEALEELARLLVESTEANNSRGRGGADDDDDDDDDDELMPGKSAASFQFEGEGSTILLRVQKCREAGLVQNRFTATIPRLEAAPSEASVVPFTLSLIRAIHENEAAAEKAIQEREAAAEQAREEIEALTEDRDEYKNLVKLMGEKWDKEKTELVNNFLELYNAVQAECEHLREQNRRSTGLRRTGNVQRARVQSDDESTPTTVGAPVEEAAAAAAAAAARSPVSDPFAEPATAVASSRPTTGMRPSSRSRGPSQKGQPAKHRKREVLQLSESDSDEQDPLAENDDDDDDDDDDDAFRVSRTTNGSPDDRVPAKKPRACDGVDAAMEDADVALRTHKRGRAPVVKSRSDKGGDDAAMERADAPSPQKSASDRAPLEGKDSDDTDMEDADDTARSPESGGSHGAKSGARDDDMDADTEDDVATHRPAAGRRTATTAAAGKEDDDAASKPKGTGRRPASKATSKRQRQPASKRGLHSRRDVVEEGHVDAMDADTKDAHLPAAGRSTASTGATGDTSTDVGDTDTDLESAGRRPASKAATSKQPPASNVALNSSRVVREGGADQPYDRREPSTDSPRGSPPTILRDSTKPYSRYEENCRRA